MPSPRTSKRDASRKHTPPPSSVRIGCFDYSIVAEDESWGRSSASLGDTDNVLLLIHYAPQNAQQEVNTIVHEIMHAACHVGQVTDAIIDARDPEHAEERFVTLAANMWHQILRDNPELVAYITQ